MTVIHAYTIQPFSTTKDNLHIYGKLYIPENTEDRIPAVILSHSANLNADSMHAYAKGFARRGYLACAFDFCGSGKHSRSDGSISDMTLFSQMQDLKAVLSAVSETDITDRNRIFLFGTSQGGLVTALTAEECEADVSGIILLYPAFNIPDLVRKTARWHTFSQWFHTGYSRAFMDSLKDYDVFQHIGHFQKPVLILHGSLDPIVNPSWSRKAAMQYPYSTLQIIHGAGHGFNKENYAIGKSFDDSVWESIDAYLSSVH
ncbi:MAG: alpha/beta hydrolase [Bulleidia sp.]